MRIGLALEAYIRAGESQRGASILIADQLSGIEHASIKRAAQDGRFRATRFKIGRTKRGYRAQRRADHPSGEELFRKSETIRVTGLAYKAERQNFAREFEGWFGAFCMDYSRTPEWLQRQERPYRERLQAAENALRQTVGRELEAPDFDILTISFTGALAELLHELERFEEAIPYYDLAITRLRAATMPMLPGYQKDTISQLNREMTDCLAHRPLKQGLGHVQRIVAPHIY